MRRLAAAVSTLLACGQSGGSQQETGGSSSTTTSTATSSTMTSTGTGADPCPIAVGDPPARIDFPDAGEGGSHDASLAGDSDGRLYMSYSGVASQSVIETRLAWSDNGGSTWCDLGVVNPSTAEPNPPDEYAGFEAHWEHEVSDLVYDASAPDGEQWKLVWHRYLWASDGTPGEARRFQYGWIAMRAAATPEGLAAAPERKLFSGAAYYVDPSVSDYNDAVIGPPEVRLDMLDPAMADCVAYTEPGMVATAEGLYVAMVCGVATPGTDRLVMVKLADGTWSYIGDLLSAADADALGAFDAFTAPDLYVNGGLPWLIASVVNGGSYRHCFGFEIDLETATIPDVDQNGPDVAFDIPTDTSTFQDGVCTFDPASTWAGALYGQVEIDGTTPLFRIVATGIEPGLQPFTPTADRR